TSSCPSTRAPSCGSSTTGAGSFPRARGDSGCRACANARCWPAANFRSGPRVAAEHWLSSSSHDHGGTLMRILVADDHGIVRSGITLLLERQPGLDVVAEAADGVEAVEQALATRPDLCILDVGMPRMTGLQAAREILAHLQGVRVLMLSMHDDEHYLFEA